MSATASSAASVTAAASSTAAGWTAQQKCFRQLMRALRAAYFHDRAQLFWARHRVLVEFYKYAAVEDAQTIEQLVSAGNRVALFVARHMKTDVERIVRHNETMMSLPVPKAREFRQKYLLHEKQHETWCKQHIKEILRTRPPPPYPFF